MRYLLFPKCRVNFIVFGGQFNQSGVQNESGLFLRNYKPKLSFLHQPLCYKTGPKVTIEISNRSPLNSWNGMRFAKSTSLPHSNPSGHQNEAGSCLPDRTA